ncbi:MAG: hypothetical protein P4N60_24445 [Verrucomicrobiae bacterium]|nr:hypothetical protein [Verrucomicrobiae bacterium]
MRISVLILVSLAVNVMLAAVFFHQHSATTGAAGDGNSTAAATTGAAAAAADNAGGQADGTMATLAGKFSWRDLPAQELKEYIRKLRAVNCPEVTVQDLIIAEVNRRFAARINAPFQDPDVAGQNDYWKPFQRKQDPEKAKKNRALFKARSAAEKEKTALIVELFGFDVQKQRLKEEGYDPDNNWNYATGDLAYLPEAKRGPVEKYLEDFQDKMQEFYTRVAGGWDADARAEQKKLEAEKLAGLAQFLTPQEVREYELRNSQIAQQISSDLHGVDLTREQYEALYDIQKKYGDSIYNYGDSGNTPEQRQQVEQNKKDMAAELATALGPDKQTELERAQDYQYQQLKSLARHNDLPVDTANKIYDFKQTAEKAVETLKANQDLTVEQRQAAAADIRAETEKSVQAALGDKLFQRYKKNGGWWINNLAPTPRPKQ